MPTITRDGALLWFVAAGALAAYLISDGTPPTEWTYQQWLQFVSAAALWGTGKLQNSSRPSSGEVRRGFRDNGEPV
jgi:hypothetical protein